VTHYFHQKTQNGQYIMEKNTTCELSFLLGIAAGQLDNIYHYLHVKGIEIEREPYNLLKERINKLFYNN